MQYFVVYFSEDGIVITPQNQEQVQKLIESVMRDTPYKKPEDIFVSKMPKDVLSHGWDINAGDYPEYKYLIIKGEMIIPEAIETVTKYRIP